MTRLALILGLVLVTALTARAEESAAAIRAVIADQIDDFQRNDLEGAFAHASPGIQMQFGGPERFGLMVRQGYPMIWRPSGWDWRGLEARPRGWVQTVMFMDAAGRIYEADYIMVEVDGSWRIDGVLMRRLPGVAS